MTRTVFVSVMFALLVMGGCAENTAPGNDRAAEYASPPAAADVASASEAVKQANLASVYPETMTTQEIGKVVRGRSCQFTYTGVGDPVLVIEVDKSGADPGRGVMKLNGKLVELRAATGRGQDLLVGTTIMEADGIRSIVRPNQERVESEGKGTQRREASLRFEIDGVEEIGFWGFYTCGRVVEGSA